VGSYGCNVIHGVQTMSASLSLTVVLFDSSASLSINPTDRS